MWGQPVRRGVDDSGRRTTVLAYLAGRGTLPGPQSVDAATLARLHPELGPIGWERVLVEMTRPAMPVDGRPGARLLYRVPNTSAYALAPAGWEAARRLTAGERGVA